MRIELKNVKTYRCKMWALHKAEDFELENPKEETKNDVNEKVLQIMIALTKA